MMPIHQLLARIRYDREFGRGEFVIGYQDRFEGTIQKVPLSQVRFLETQRGVFELIEKTGQVRRVPFHRVREVYRDGAMIWCRSG